MPGAAHGAYRGDMSNLVRRRGSLDVVDTAVGVGVAIIAALILWNILTWVIGGLIFLVKVAVVALVVAVVIRLWSGFRRS